MGVFTVYHQYYNKGNRLFPFYAEWLNLQPGKQSLYLSVKFQVVSVKQTVENAKYFIIR